MQLIKIKKLRELIKDMQDDCCIAVASCNDDIKNIETEDESIVLITLGGDKK